MTLLLESKSDESSQEPEGESSLFEAYESHLADISTCCSALEFCLQVINLTTDQDEHWKRITYLVNTIDSLEVCVTVCFKNIYI